MDKVTQAMAINPKLILDAIRVLLEPGQVTELRALDVSTRAYPRPHIVSGYFDDPAKLAAEAAKVAPFAMGTYIIPNQVNPALLARANNRSRNVGDKDPLTTDKEIQRRCYFMIDCDPVRPAGISSTEAEHDAALARAQEIRDTLTGLGWPEPIQADSGNGGHLLYRIDLSNDEETRKLLECALKVLAFRHSDPAITLDQTVFNASRIWKLYGTPAAKGDDVPDRPHRIARLLHVPNERKVVPQSLIEALAARLPKQDSPRDDGRTGHREGIDLAEWIAEHNLEVIGPRDWEKGKLWIFPVCPWDDAHRNRSAYLIQFSNGGIAAGCHHNGCAGKGWPDLRDVTEPGWQDGQAEVGRGAEATPRQGARGPSQAEVLVELASETDRFHDPTRDAYARVLVGSHHELFPVKSRDFRLWLLQLFYERSRKVPNAESLSVALNQIEASAQFDGECRKVYLRVAPGDDGTIYVDLADPLWRVVRVAANGWDILTDSPVMFRRSAVMQPLPEPTHGGRLDDLRSFVNVRSEADWALVKGWLTHTFTTEGAKAILALEGEQGTAKSTVERVLQRLIDPAWPDLRRPPRDERDLAIAARSSWLVAYDNVSEIAPWLSDSLCSLATGRGFGTRQLWSDFDEALFQAKRSVVMNGIEPFIIRGDLADRAVRVVCPMIDDRKRQDEASFWRDFDDQWPGIFGALLDRVAGALRELPNVTLSRLPRMADFALFAVAAERGSGDKPAFLSAYQRLRGDSHLQAIEASLVGPVLLRFFVDLKNELWEGTATELLKSLSLLARESDTKQKEWPKTGRALSGELRRLAPALRSLGHMVTFLGNRGKNRARLIRLVPKLGGKARSHRSDITSSTALHADNGPHPISDQQGANGANGVNDVNGVIRAVSEAGVNEDGPGMTDNDWAELLGPS
jgi:hypothetical protein